MLGFILGASVFMNILFILGLKGTVERLKGEVEEYKKSNKSEVVESYSSKTAVDLIKACGGIDNISECDVCVTRLKLKVKDISKVDVDYIKGCKYNHFINNDYLQLIMGTSSVKSDICYLINNIR